jgi:hypothetical protein
LGWGCGCGCGCGCGWGWSWGWGWGWDWDWGCYGNTIGAQRINKADRSNNRLSVNMKLDPIIIAARTVAAALF